VRASERLLAVVALLAASAAHADYKQSYARGKEAAEAGRWAEVATRMREAMAEQGEPQARVRIYGMRFEPYVPQFYLGLAAYRQGNCAEAVRSWQDAATASIVAGDGTLKGIVDSGIADCRRKLGGTLAQQPATAPTTPTAANPPASGTATPVASQAPATTPPAGAPPAATPVRPPPSAPPASAPVASTPPRPTPAPTTAPPSAAPPAATSKPVAGSAPPALVAALDCYLAGRIEQTASLDLGGLADPRARYHALLLRSAARHTLAQAGGERGEALLAAAQADIRAARALAPAQQPDAALFSPRFRRLYESTR
jgi:hypothetical protein